MTSRTLAWTGFIAIVAFVLMAASRVTLLDPVENVTLNVTSPLQAAMRGVTRPVADWVNNITDAGALSNENKKLRDENERLTNELARAREDTSGAAIRQLLVGIGGEVGRYEIVPDEREVIAATLATWCDEGGVDLILTTGGTGLASRDVTPEATLDVAERLAPGIAEAMRAEGMRHTPKAMLSRAVAAVRGRTLIINLPGSEKGVRESLGAVLDVLPHAVELLQGRTEHPAAG